MPTTTTNQILDAYKDRYEHDELQDVPGFEGTWDAFFELCELAERIIDNGRVDDTDRR